MKEGLPVLLNRFLAAMSKNWSRVWRATRPPSVAVRYRFEERPSSQQSAFESFSRDVERAVQTAPTAIPTLPFGVSSRLSSGVLEPLREGSADFSSLRLKAIESANAVLLRNLWGADGELSQSVYPDGQRVAYTYDAEQRLRSATLNDTVNVAFEYDSEGLLLKATYGKSPPATFAFDRSIDGNLSGVKYPQGWLSFKRDEAGRMIAYESDAGSVRYERENTGGLVRIGLASGESKLAFDVTTGDVNVLRQEGPGDSMTTIMSPLGVHMVMDNGRVHSWLRWDGQLMKFFYHSNGLFRSIRSSKGATTFEYAKDGRVLSIFRPDGTRYYWQRCKDEHAAILAGPGGAVLLRYNNTGQLQSIMDSWGGYVAVGYGRFLTINLPRKVSSPLWGSVDIGYGKGDRLISVAVTGKGRVCFDYDSRGQISAIRWKSPDSQGATGLLHLAGWLWTLLAAGKSVYVGGFEWSHWIG